MSELGLIHYYYGDGKGKTTAALGQLLRHLGYSRQILVVQFLKNRASGEVSFLRQQPQVRLWRGKVGSGLPSRLSEDDRQATREMQNGFLQEAIAAVAAGNCSLLVLDEVSDAYRLDLLDPALLFGFLRHKPAGLEIVMTGHKPLPEFIEIADYVTEMRKEKHPFERGIGAREGIEY